MGTYAVCMFGNLHVTESKSEVDPELMKLFRATERQVRRADDPKLPAVLRDRYADAYDRGDGNDHDDFRVIYYEVDPYSISDRLDIFGYTIDAARRLFDEWRSLEIKQQESLDSALLGEEHDADIQRLRDLTPINGWNSFARLQ